MRCPATVTFALALFPLVASGQSVTLDEGSFTIMRGSQRLGREDFTIRRTSDVIVANGTVTMADRQLFPALRTNSAGHPLRYQMEIRRGGAVVQQLRGVMGRGRFSAQTKTPGGESSREYPIADAAVVLDDDVFHHYYFLALALRASDIPIVVPHRNAQLFVHVEKRGIERIEVGGISVEATHLVITSHERGARDFWVDGQGRVLKVSLGDQDIVATRDDPPGR
ncbi:MAG: hypothetical protein M3068_01575 [Gemmatimonadota bacterium]|nr:hypothetical protein [Gemmatimonadota bacterium]